MPDHSSVGGAVIYEKVEGLGPNVDAWGGEVSIPSANVPVDSQPYIAVRRGAAIFPDNGPPNPAWCIEVGALMVHELQHSKGWDWWIDLCNESALAAGDDEVYDQCMNCVASIYACMRAHNSNGEKVNQLEESRAHFATFLCLCQSACELPEGDPKRQLIENAASSELLKAVSEWTAGLAVFNQHCASTSQQCGFGGAYPMQPINPGGQPEAPYTGPLNPDGTPKHVDLGPNGEMSCDCDQFPLEFDSCDEVEDD